MVPHVTEQDIKNFPPKVKYLTAFSATWLWHKLCFRQSLPFTVGVKSAVNHAERTLDARSSIYASYMYCFEVGCCRITQPARVIWCGRQNLIRSHLDILKLYCSWHCWSSTMNNSNQPTCCSNLLRNNSLCQTYPVYSKESQQLFHICSRSKYCSVTFIQQKLMYSLMIDQLGPKHAAV